MIIQEISPEKVQEFGEEALLRPDVTFSLSKRGDQLALIFDHPELEETEYVDLCPLVEVPNIDEQEAQKLLIGTQNQITGVIKLDLGHNCIVSKGYPWPQMKWYFQ